MIPQILAAAAFEGRLNQSLLTFGDGFWQLDEQPLMHSLD
jgi:hypothetical protein